MLRELMIRRRSTRGLRDLEDKETKNVQGEPGFLAFRRGFGCGTE